MPGPYEKLLKNEIIEDNEKTGKIRVEIIIWYLFDYEKHQKAQNEDRDIV